MVVPDSDKGYAVDEEEIRVLTTTLDSFKAYTNFTVDRLVEPRRAKYARLDDKYKKLVDKFFLKHLDAVQDAIESNGFFLDTVAEVAAMNFDAPEDRSQWSRATMVDVDKAQSTIRQLYREWSAEGRVERDQYSLRIFNELTQWYPDRKQRHQVRVLVPGCGLGRLPLDLAALGFQAQGNEFSFHMLFTSNFIINHLTNINEFRIFPNVHSFSHHRNRSHQVQPVLIPDLSPSILLQHAANDPDIPEDGLMSMTAGSFDMIYPPPDGSLFDVVVTVFFLDTAANVFNTLQTLSDSLEEGGKWINYGPLLWHYEEIPPDGSTTLDPNSQEEDRSCGFEFSLEDVIDLLPKFGFRIDKRESDIPTTYTHSPLSMGGYLYKCEYWVATKVTTDIRE